MQQITVLSCWHPYPADNGAKLRILALLQALSRTYTVDLIVVDSAYEAGKVVPPLAGICRSVVTIPSRSFDPRSLRARLAYFSLRPRSVVASYNPMITTLLKHRIATQRCDAILCMCCGNPHTAQYGLDVAEYVPVFVDDLETVRFADIRQIKSFRGRLQKTLTFWKYRRFVRALSAKGAGYFATSQTEADHLRTITNRADWIILVPNGVSISDNSSPRNAGDPYRLIYNGAPTYAPNRDAVAFFTAEILPLILAEQPEAWLAVTGGTAGVSLEEFAPFPNVVFTGWQSDIRTYVSESSVCVVPLRQGGGTRLKILEAMAVATPVVATRKGAQGLDVTDGKDILLADSPTDFARATLRLLTDCALSKQIAQQAQHTVAQQYDWNLIGEDVRAGCARLAAAWERSKAPTAPCAKNA